MVRNFFGQRDEAASSVEPQTAQQPMPVDTPGEQPLEQSPDTAKTDPLPPLNQIIAPATQAQTPAAPDKPVIRLSEELPPGFSGKIRNLVVLPDPGAKGGKKAFKRGQEAKLFAHLARHREALPHALSELEAMKAVSGDWKLQYAKLVKE